MRSKTAKYSPDSHHSTSPSSSPQLLITATLTESILKDTIESAEKIIPRWWYCENSNHCMITSLFSGDDTREEATEFISAVNNLQSAVRLSASNNASSNLLVRSQELLLMAMKRLGREFNLILKFNGEHLDPSSVSNRSPAMSDRLLDCENEVFREMESLELMDLQRTPTVQAMKDLKSIADCMMNCGYSKECAKIYRNLRKSIVDDALHRLGIDRLSLSLQHHKLDWEVIDKKIKNWLSAVKIAAKSVFYQERILCDLLFSSSSTARESYFSEVARDNAVSLFGFPEQVVSKCKKSPEKLFRILDLYEAILELSPEINNIFSSESSSVVRSQVETSLEKLREAALTTLAELESAIQKDSSKTPVTGGGVHPLTRYVMNYLAFLADYGGVLEEILATWQLSLHAPLPEEYLVAQRSGDKKANVSIRFAWLILVLLSKLDAKSDVYKEVSLSYLFLANNLRYVVKKVQTSELRPIVGEGWVTRHEEKVRQYAASYERTGWRKVMDPLLEGGKDDSNHRTVEACLERAKERFRKFNGAFVEVQKKHMEWVVVDPKLREEIKESLARNIASKYRAFYTRYRDKLAGGNMSAESVVRYAPEDLENYLWGLLFGCSDGDSRSRSRSRAATTSASSSLVSTSSPLRARTRK